jgi:hypothetical protein
MGTRMNITVFAIAVVVIGAACGQSRSPSAHTGQPTTTAAQHGARDAVSLILERGSPPKPPSVALVVKSGAHDIVVNGVALVTGEWITDRNAPQPTLQSTIRWPRATTIEGGDSPTIEFHTPYVPDFVVVRTYTALDEVNQVPLGMPIATFGCNQFTAPQCKVVASKSGIRVLGLDQTIYTGEYIVVYSEWHLPTKVEGSGVYAQGSLPASWLFRIAHTRATAP